MAHSIQEYKGKSAIFDDIDLLVIIGFAVGLADQSQRFEKIRGLLDDWRASLPKYGPGVIELNLDEIAQAPEAVQELKELMKLVLRHVSQYHEEIPATVLNDELPIKANTGVTFHGDLKTSFIKEAVEKIEALIGE